MDRRILAIMAHPDDIEFLCAGTLALLHRRDYSVHMATMTPGDCGSVELSPEEISMIRVREAQKSAAILGATYDCVECRDLFILYDASTIRRVVELIRRYDPFIVITHSPQDYMLDHELTSTVVRNATFGAGMPNVRTADPDPARPTSTIPYLYYADPIMGKDIFACRIKPQFYVDVTATIEVKEKMLKCHASQRQWMLKHHGVDEYVRFMKEWSAERGKEVGVPFAEAFRQHIGHAYPQENILTTVLPEEVKWMSSDITRSPS